jgi:hypothetical protein
VKEAAVSGVIRYGGELIYIPLYCAIKTHKALVQALLRYILPAYSSCPLKIASLTSLAAS